MVRYTRTQKRHTTRRGSQQDPRLRVAHGLLLAGGGLIVARLFILMILQHGFYTALAAGSHEVYAQLFPERGSVYMQDSRSGEEFPLAINRDLFTVYADTRLIPDKETAESIAEELAAVFSYTDEEKFAAFQKLDKYDDPYEPLEQKVEESVVDVLREKNLPGIGFARISTRFYPEGPLASHVIGFVGKTEDGKDIGRYGVEGYWEQELAGTGGFFEGSRSASGFWIPLAGRQFEAAEDGADVLLTVDRTLQFVACDKLAKAAVEFGATSASLIIMDPHTGAIRAMCGVPDFDPNTYNKVDSITVYNNKAIFTPYEVGSIFKPIAMAGALNERVISPTTGFYDSGSVEDVCDKPIRNADLKVYDQVSMTEVLEYSINTGMVNVVQRLGKGLFARYMEDFGFGIKGGIGLDTEEAGTISSVYKNKGDKIDCYAATASFGQGITATPLQMVTAFSAIANGGTLLKPYVVEEVRHSDGRIDRFGREEIRQVIDKRAASLLAGMMVTVVDKGHAGSAKIPGYYVAGKTGTAQIPGPGGYTEETNHSFVGFAPVDDPAFVAIVKFEKPQRRFSASTAAPVFGDIARFVLQYYQIPPGR